MKCTNTRAASVHLVDLLSAMLSLVDRQTSWSRCHLQDTESLTCNVEMVTSIVPAQTLRFSTRICQHVGQLICPLQKTLRHRCKDDPTHWGSMPCYTPNCGCDAPCEWAAAGCDALMRKPFPRCQLDSWRASWGGHVTRHAVVKGKGSDIA